MDIGQILSKQGYVDEETLKRAESTASEEGRDLGDLLLAWGTVTEAVLQDARSLLLSLEVEQFESKKAFMETVLPFSALKEEDRDGVAATMTWKSFAPGEAIIRQGTEGSQFYLIKSGLVRVYLEQGGTDVVLGFLGEGDCFGEMSLLTGAPTSATVETVEHTLCLVQNKGFFLEVVKGYPVFRDFFNQLLTQRMKTVYKELLTASPGVTHVEPYLYRKQVRDLLGEYQADCTGDITIKEAAQKLIENKAGALIVKAKDGTAMGIVDRDHLLKAVLMDGTDPSAPIGTIVEKNFHSVDSSYYFFDALHEMVKHRTNQLVVLDKEEVKGIVTGFDLLRFRGREVLSLVKNIEAAHDVLELDRMRQEVEKVLRALIADGALASNACKIVSELNDKIVNRIIHLSEEALGAPPASYAWLGLGSEGRREQTLVTDQDNALIFSGETSPEKVAYYEELARKVVEGLNGCGFPLCKGGIMATSPKYFGSLTEWKERTGKWIGASSLPEKDLIDIYVFLDFRAVHGNPGLERSLRDHVMSLIKSHPAFAQTLAANIVSVPVPLGFFKNFVVEKSGQYKNTVNLKTYGLLPLTTCVKILCFHTGVHETNTLERIKALSGNGVVTVDQAEFLIQAFETFLTLKIRNNLTDADRGRDFSNRIEPATLTTKQKQLLKEAFLAVSQVQKVTKDHLRISDSAIN
jgi:CBS domain-containing protein